MTRPDERGPSRPVGDDGQSVQALGERTRDDRVVRIPLQLVVALVDEHRDGGLLVSDEFDQAMYELASRIEDLR